MTGGGGAVVSWAWLMPVLCASLAALLTRGIAITSSKARKKAWVFETLVTALTVLVAAVITEERDLSIMFAMFTGIGVGAMGVGIISIARTAAVTMITNLAKSILSATPPVDKI